MDLTKQYKILPLSVNGKKIGKQITALAVWSMLITFLQEASSVEVLGFISCSLAQNPPRSKRKCHELQQYFKPKLGRKIRIFNLNRKNTIFKKKKSVHYETMSYTDSLDYTDTKHVNLLHLITKLCHDLNS